MHDHVTGRDADDDQPVTTAGGPADRAAVEIAAGDGDANGDLLLQRLEAGLVAEAGRDVPELPHPRQLLIVSIGASQDTGLEEGQEHGAAG